MREPTGLPLTWSSLDPSASLWYPISLIPATRSDDLPCSQLLSNKHEVDIPPKIQTTLSNHTRPVDPTFPINAYGQKRPTTIGHSPQHRRLTVFPVHQCVHLLTPTTYPSSPTNTSPSCSLTAALIRNPWLPS